MAINIRNGKQLVYCVGSNGQGPVCDAVKRSSNKNNGQNILTPVAAVTTAPMAMTTPCQDMQPLGHVNKLRNLIGQKSCDYFIIL